MLNIQKRLDNSFFALLSLPATAMGFALSVQISALSWILSTKYGLDIHEVGWVWLAGPVAGLLAQPIVGLVSDKVWFWNGRRRPFILIGGTIAALMLLCLPNLDVIANVLHITNMTIVALMVALTLDLAINVSFNPTRTIIADLTPEGEKRTNGFTWMQTVSGFFGVVAYAIGAVWGNYFLIYFGVFLVLAFSLIPTFFIEEPRHLTPDKNLNPEADEEEYKTEMGQLMPIFIAHGFTWLGVQTMFVFIFAFIDQKMNLDSDTVGQTIAIAFLIMNLIGFIFPALVLRPIANKIGVVKTHRICIASMALAYGFIAFFGNTQLSLYIAMAFVGIGWAATVSLPFAIFSEKVSKSQMGFYMGIFNMSVVIPQIIVSGVFGLIIGAAGDKNIIFIISAVSLAVSAVLWYFVKENKKVELGDSVSGGGH